MRIYQITLLTFLFAALSCKPKYSTEPQPKTVAKINFTGMSSEKLVKTKYDSLKVVCGMNAYPIWSGEPMSLARAEWNLLTEFSDSKTLQFSAEVSESSLVQVRIHLDRLSIISNLTGKDDAGIEYLMKNTPAVQARVEWRQVLGNLVQKGHTSRITMLESISAELLSLNTARERAEDETNQLVRIICQTVAGPKPEYQDEFQKR